MLWPALLDRPLAICQQRLEAILQHGQAEGGARLHQFGSLGSSAATQRREQSALQLCSAFLALDSAHAERCGYQIQVLKDRTLWQCDGIACDLQARLLLCVCCTNSYTRDRADRFACRRLSCRTRTDAACLRTSSVSCFFSVVEIDRAS